MAKSQKPRVLLKCVANTYTSDRERIIEFTFPDGAGGLISFVTGVDERPNRVDVYRVDSSIQVLK